MRVAVRGGDDPVELTDISGVWISEDCEPVQVQFAWQRKTQAQIVEEAECICSHELASRLIHLLWNGTNEPEMAKAAQRMSPPTAERGARTEIM
jgi:hypothetical protein